MPRSVSEWRGATDDTPAPPRVRLRVLEVLSCDMEAGVFTWKERADRSRSWNTRWAGKIAGGIDAHGYRTILIDGVSYKAHRLVWLVSTGSWPSGDLDHKNRDRADNRISNLRECSRAENMQNQKVRADNATGYTGVSFCRQTGKWRAKIRIDGDQIHLGRFSTPEEARDAYLTAKGGLHRFNPTLEAERYA